MSGYRTLHREKVESTAIWNVATSPVLISSSKRAVAKNNSSSSSGYRVWTASADGLVRSYLVQEKSIEEKQHDSVLDASALGLTCSHVLLGTSQEEDLKSGDAAADTKAITMIGCTQVSVARNYVGDDDAAGDLIVASLEMTGMARLWVFLEDEDGTANSNSNNSDSKDDASAKQVRAAHEFKVENATGTVMMVCPPRWSGPGQDVSVAVACLDGTIAQVATGLLTPQRLADTTSPSPSSKTKEASPAGTVLDQWGSAGSSIPLSIATHPQSAGVLAIGRQDGQLDILTNNNTNNTAAQAHQKHRRNRLRLPGHDNNDVPIRAVAYSPDGHMLAAGNDAGMMAVWDVSRPSSSAVLVHHIVKAHASWILNIMALPDSRRWVSCGADRKLHVWKNDIMHQPVHTFDSDQTVWTLGLATATPSTAGPTSLDKSKATVRLAAGTETGGLQILSLDS